MKYELTDYQGNKLTLPAEKAGKIADIAELIEVEVSGQKHYLNPRNIASIKPVPGSETIEASNAPRLAAPDHRGKPSPALEKIREKWGKPDVPPSEQKAA